MITVLCIFLYNYIFLTVLAYTPHLWYTLVLDARSSCICSSTPCHSLDAGRQTSFDRWISGLEGARRTGSPVLDTTVHHLPLPATGGKSVPDTEKRHFHPQEIVSKNVLVPNLLYNEE